MPVPHASSEPVKVVFVAASWQTRLVPLGFFSEYVEPVSVVGNVTLPAYAVLPVPSATCSLVASSLPERASTYTDWREAWPWSRPTTPVSHARWEVLPCETTRRGGAAPLTLST